MVKKNTKAKLEKILPIVGIIIASSLIATFLSNRIMGGTIAKFANLQQASIAGAFLSEKSAPFYKVPSYSARIPNDEDLIELPSLTLRDNILLKEENEVIVSLYKLGDGALLKSAPLFSVQVGVGKEYQYTAGEYGAGEFALITTQTGESCANLIISDCLALNGFIAERQYKVVSDTYTYLFASPDKTLIAKFNAEKNVKAADDDAGKSKGVVETIVETIKDAVTGLFDGNAPTDTTTEDTVDTPLTPSSGFEILPAPGGETNSETPAAPTGEPAATEEPTAATSTETSSAPTEESTTTEEQSEVSGAALIFSLTASVFGAAGSFLFKSNLGAIVFLILLLVAIFLINTALKKWGNKK